MKRDHKSNKSHLPEERNKKERDNPDAPIRKPEIPSSLLLLVVIPISEPIALDVVLLLVVLDALTVELTLAIEFLEELTLASFVATFAL